MARRLRNRILSEVNHVMLRGNGHMDLFLAEGDYRRFLNTLQKYKDSDDITIMAYCLMTNHVHLLLKSAPESIPAFFKKIEVSYVRYFNSIYEHTGHLFQDRYRSEPIKDEGYLLNAFRYILKNPEAAGICRWDKYRWSSAKCYLTDVEDGITDTSVITGLAGIAGRKDLLFHFSESDNDLSKVHVAEPKKSCKAVCDNEAMLIFRRISGIKSPEELRTMEKGMRKDILVKLKKTGLSVRQLERITGINRNVIQRAK